MKSLVRLMLRLAITVAFIALLYSIAMGFVAS